MKNSKLSHLLFSVLAILILFSPLVTADSKMGDSQSHKVTVPLSFDYYYSYDMMVEALRKLHKAYPELAKLDLVGKSEEGRGIYCMTINNPKTGNALDKPAIYIDGNIHGNEIQATEVALYLLDYLLGNYKKNQELTQLVDKKVFYVIPTVNVDGRYHFFTDPNTPDTNRGLRRPHDDDHDGLVDEDFPDDLDKDGNICVMRKRDPHGKFKTDPIDPRLMIKVQPGEKGEWTVLGMEGIDNDGDGKINEDSEGYVDANRNWGYDWMPDYVQEGSGDYPFSGVGVKAIAQYIMKRPNICMSWAFHNYGGMYLRGPSTKSQPEYPFKDIAVYNYLGRQSERITPSYRYLISWKDLYSTYGDFGEWMVMINGCYSFVGELFVPRSETFKIFKESKINAVTAEKDDDPIFSKDPNLDRERLKFNDNLTQGELYTPWKPFKHPTYGDIEIGGWVKFSSRLPAPFMLKELVHRNASAVIFSAKQTPDVSMEVFHQKKISDNLYRIRIRLINSSAMPSMSYHAQEKKLYPKDILKVTGKNIKVVAGGELKDAYKNQVSFVEYRPHIQFLSVPGFDKIEYEFLISGSGNISIQYNSRHAGKIIKTLQLQ